MGGLEHVPKHATVSALARASRTCLAEGFDGAHVLLPTSTLRGLASVQGWSAVRALRTAPRRLSDSTFFELQSKTHIRFPSLSLTVYALLLHSSVISKCFDLSTILWARAIRTFQSEVSIPGLISCSPGFCLWLCSKSAHFVLISVSFVAYPSVVPHFALHRPISTSIACLHKCSSFTRHVGQDPSLRLPRCACHRDTHRYSSERCRRAFQLFLQHEHHLAKQLSARRGCTDG